MNKYYQLIFTFLLLSILTLQIKCSKEASVVELPPATKDATTTGTGSDRLQIEHVYPTNTSPDINVDTDIILVFNIPVTPASINTTNVQITWGANNVTGFNVIPVGPPGDEKTYILQITTTTLPSNNLGYLATITVDVGTGIYADAAHGGAGNTLLAGSITTFDTTSDDSTFALPYVIASSRIPTGGPVSRNTNGIYVTFSKDMNFATITTASFYTTPGAGTSVTQISDRTYCLNLSTPLLYAQIYTVTLDTAIIQDTNTNFLQAPPVWTFTTENDPNPGAPTISSVWIDSVTNSTATVYFTTSKPVSDTECFIDYATTTGGPYTSLAEGATTTLKTSHSFTILGLNPNTRYYLRARVTPPGATSAEITVGTKTDLTVNSPLTITATDPSGLKTIQVSNGASNGASYAFWLDGGQVFGQFFDASGAIQWGANGTAVATTVATYDFVAASYSRYINDNAVVTYHNTTAPADLYLKMVHENIGCTFTWGAPANSAAAAGFTIAGNFKSGTAGSICRVHERPTLIIQNQTMDVPTAGYPNNLLFDMNTDFSGLGLVNNDIILWDNAGSWLQGTIFSANSWGVFRHCVRNTLATGLTASTFRLANSAHYTTGTGTVDAVNPLPPPFRFEANDAFFPGISAGDKISCLGAPATITTITAIVPLGGGIYQIDTLANHNMAVNDTFSIIGNVDSFLAVNQFTANDAFLAGVTAGDIINCNGASWAVISSITVAAGPIYTITTDVNHGLVANNYFIVYPRRTGALSSQLVYNAGGPYYPLWDNNPVTVFNPGTTVLAGDYVINENNNTAPATSAVVSTIDLSKDNDRAARMSMNIIGNGNNYGIVRLPTGATYRSVGYSTAIASFRISDTNAAFVAGNVGDIIFNIDNNISAEVTGYTDANTLSISADIFNATNQKYIIYRKRGVLTAYINTSDDLAITVRNLADGSSITAATTIQAGTFSNPHTVSTESGHAMIFYTNTADADIYALCVSASGTILWGPTAMGLANYSIKKVLPENRPYSAAALGASGAYLLAANTNTVALIRVPGAIVWTQTFTGYEPDMDVDRDSLNANRVIIAYQVEHVTASGNFFNIEARAYDNLGALVAPMDPLVVSDNSATAIHHCFYPKVRVSEDSVAAYNSFYVTWFDGRYYGLLGYSVITQGYDNLGTPVWATDRLVSSPTSYGMSDPLSMEVLLYNDGGAPFGIIPIWFDYRDASTDLYYQLISNP